MVFTTEVAGVRKLPGIDDGEENHEGNGEEQKRALQSTRQANARARRIRRRSNSALKTRPQKGDAFRG